MKAIKILKLSLMIILGSLILITYSCKTLQVDVKLNPDGSGERTVELSMSEIPEGELNIEDAEFSKLFNVDGSEWEYIVYRKENQGEQAEEIEKHVYRRTQRAKKLEDWHKLGGDINIYATLDDDRYAKVVITNTIDVELGTSQGGRSLTYRETVSCTEMRQTLLSFMSYGYIDKISAAYPMLKKEELVELRGLIMGYLAVAWHLQAESDVDIDEKRITKDLAEDANAIIRKKHPDADLTQLNEIITKTYDDLEDDLDSFVMENLPGMYLAGHATFILHLEMPGSIAENNADIVEGQKLTWKVDLLEVFVKPIEVFARAELAD